MFLKPLMKDRLPFFLHYLKGTSIIHHSINLRSQMTEGLETRGNRTFKKQVLLLFLPNNDGVALAPGPCTPVSSAPKTKLFGYRISSISILVHSFFWHLRMGKLLEVLKFYVLIMTSFWNNGGFYSREEKMYLRKYGISDEINSAFLLHL